MSDKKNEEKSCHPTHEYEVKKTIYTVIIGGAVFIAAVGIIIYMMITG